jgi:ABC-type multidrug transport system fused ATPase/permease subunit
MSRATQPLEDDARSGRSQRSSLPRIYGGRRRRLLWLLIANGLAQGATLLTSALLLRRVLAAGGSSPIALVALASSGAAIVALRVLAAGTAERLGQEYVTRVRLRILEAIVARPTRAKRGTRAGLTMTRVISDLGSLRRWVSEGVARSCVASLTLGGAIAALAWLEPTGALVVAAVAITGACLALAFAPVLRGYVREARRRRGRLASTLGERLLASGTVHKLGSTRRELRRVRVLSQNLRDALVRRARAAEALRALPELLTPAAIVLWILLSGVDDLAEVASGILVLGVLGASLRDLARAVDHRLAFDEGVRRIAALLGGPRLAVADNARALAGSGPASLEFTGVSVENVLNAVTVTAHPGQSVLVAGSAAEGKSTLLALAARLLDPDSGQVRIAGEQLPELTLDSLHAAVQLVSPDLPLLRGSVAENLQFGASHGDARWLDEVARACGLVDEPGLREGLSSRVEERGANLSAGMRARISLARAIAMRPRLLLVDDPVFSVDEQAAGALRSSYALLGATTLVVAPEDSALLPFDAIWVVANGEISERPRPVPTELASAVARPL